MGMWMEQLLLEGLMCCFVAFIDQIYLTWFNTVIPSIWILTWYANLSHTVVVVLRIQMLVFSVLLLWSLITDDAFELIPGNREVLHSLPIIWYLYSFWCSSFIVLNTLCLPYIVCNTVCDTFSKMNKYGSVVVKKHSCYFSCFYQC